MRNLSTPVSSPVTHLHRRQTFSLAGKRGQRIEVRSGEIWVTQDGDPRDLVLGAHQCFTLDRSGQLLISALRDASFAFRAEAKPVRVPNTAVCEMLRGAVGAAAY
ncbi:MAG: DUF2917 domain-containing protein [Rhizobacter sp.]